MNYQDLIELAELHGWALITIQENIGMISFNKLIDGNIARVNIYTTKATVATSLTHPKKGKTQLFRKNVSLKEMEIIFKNPRVHTKKGYYTTKESKK